MARTFRITESLKSNAAGSQLLVVTVTALTGDGDPCVFLVRKLSDVEEDDTELIDICSKADLSTYGTDVSLTEMYRVSTITVAMTTQAKYAVVRADLIADLPLILQQQITEESNPDDEVVEYNDASGAVGPFVFNDSGELT